MKPESLSETQVSEEIKSAITEAVSFIEGEIEPARLKSDKYFQGKVNLSREEGRSASVATKCRDTVRAIKPALMRVFLQSGNPVEFSPNRPDVVEDAQMRTEYAARVFAENNGFCLLDGAFNDALIKKTGILKAYFDETDRVEVDEYTGLTELQAQFVSMQKGVEVLEVTRSDDGFDMRVARTEVDGRIKIDAIAPEDFFVDRDARSIDDCYICGHSTEVRVGDVVAMGFDFDEVFEHAGSQAGTSQDEAEIQRKQGGGEQYDESGADLSMRRVVFTEAYMRMDVDGTGVPQLHKFLCVGNDYHVLEFSPADQVPFAVFEVDMEAHTFFGRSLVEIIQDDQDVSTSILRGLIDNVHMVNNPRLLAVDKAVNMDDLLNGEIGGVVRVHSPDAVRELVVGSAAQTAMPLMTYYDDVIRAKTGVSGAGMGLDADALQSQTAAGVNAAVQAATAVSELIARTLAETGMKQLFRLIVRLAAQHPQKDEMVRVDGQYVPVDPTSWATDLSMTVNVGLGNNQHDQKIMALQNVAQFQAAVMQTMGLGNGLVGLTQLRNTQADLLRMAGLPDADRYMMPMTADAEMQMMMQAQQAAQQQGAPDPTEGLVQVEAMKVQQKAQSDAQKAQIDAQKAQADHELKVAEMMRQDDLARDKMAQDLAVDAARIAGQYGAAVDTARVKAEQAAPRPVVLPNG